jgi:hypothetical protein
VANASQYLWLPLSERILSDFLKKIALFKNTAGQNCAFLRALESSGVRHGASAKYCFDDWGLEEMRTACKRSPEVLNSNVRAFHE